MHQQKARTGKPVREDRLYKYVLFEGIREIKLPKGYADLKGEQCIHCGVTFKSAETRRVVAKRARHEVYASGSRSLKYSAVQARLYSQYVRAAAACLVPVAKEARGLLRSVLKEKNRGHVRAVFYEEIGALDVYCRKQDIPMIVGKALKRKQIGEVSINYIQGAATATQLSDGTLKWFELKETVPSVVAIEEMVSLAENRTRILRDQYLKKKQGRQISRDALG